MTAPAGVEERRVAWRGAFAAAALSALGQLGFLVIKLQLVGVTRLTWEQGAHALVCVGLLVLLWQRRASAGARLSYAALVLTALPFLVTMWTGELERAAFHLPFTPFVGEKLVVVGVALLAPTLWLGAGLIAAFAVEVVVIASFLDFGQPAQAAGEPWITLVYCLVAVGLLLHRLRALRLEREIAGVRAEARANERLVRTLLAARDLANTPLQTIAINLALLEHRPGDPRPMTRIAHALGRLRELDALLGANVEVSWQPGTESFDPRAVLAARR